MTVRAEIASSPAVPRRSAASPGLPPRGGVRLRALVLIRWAAVAGQLFTAAVVQWGLGFGLPVLRGRRHDRALGAAQPHRQPRPAGIGAHRRPRGHDLPRLRHPAARRAALSHRRSAQSLRAAAAGAGRHRRHHPVAQQQRRAVAADDRQHRRAGGLSSAAAVARAAARTAGHLPGRRLGGPHADDTPDHALWLAAGRGGAADGRCAGGGAGSSRPRAAAVGAGRAGCRRGARTRLAALDHRRRRQGDVARDRARRSAARGCRVAVGRIRALPFDPGAPLRRSGRRRVRRLYARAAAGADRGGGAELRSRHCRHRLRVGSGRRRRPDDGADPGAQPGDHAGYRQYRAERRFLRAARGPDRHALDDRMVGGRGDRRRPGLLRGDARRTGHALHFDPAGPGGPHGSRRLHRQDASGAYRGQRDLRKSHRCRAVALPSPCAGQTPSSRLHSGRCRRSCHEPGRRSRPPRIARDRRRDVRTRIGRC